MMIHLADHKFKIHSTSSLVMLCKI